MRPPKRHIDELLHYLKDKGGSDLHLAAGMAPHVRMSGTMGPVPGWDVLDHEELRAMMFAIAAPVKWDEYEDGGDLDFAYGLPGVARFRANYLRQDNGAGAVLRIIPEKIKTLEDLGMPPAVERLAHLTQGLVLVTGPTGSGKSTTLAAIIDRINTTYAKHIITIEDPIEFVHPNKKCVFSQREVGAHTKSFAAALRSAIRQNPDVILVGEMRDQITIELAVTAAEMGVLVFGTLHTNSAIKTIDRLIDAFPADQQDQVRLSLSDSLYGIVAQLLLPTADGKGRCAVNEIMIRTAGLPNLIREGKTTQLASLIQGGRAVGMQTMDDALMEFVQQGRIAPRDAYMKSNDKSRFEKLMQGDDKQLVEG
ncbi:MAG: type IV pilus twitching motility protein PilT [Kofleriaceae bacterium]